MHGVALLSIAAVAAAQNVKPVQAVKIEGINCSALNITGVEGNFRALSASFRTSLSGLGASSTRVSLGDVTLTKEFDACSVALFSKITLRHFDPNTAFGYSAAP